MEGQRIGRPRIEPLDTGVGNQALGLAVLTEP